MQCWCSYSGEYEQYGIAERDPEGLLLDNACKFPLLEASGSCAKGTKRKRKGEKKIVRTNIYKHRILEPGVMMHAFSPRVWRQWQADLCEVS